MTSFQEPSGPDVRDAAPDDARSTRERILDAAEDVFAHRGYFAATIRGITQSARVELSLARYYFGSKDELFRQVVLRRADAICEMLDASLALARQEAGPDRPPGLRAVVEAMIGPALSKLASGDLGWRNYLRLLSGFALLHDQAALLAPWRARYASTARQFHAALAAAQPDAPEYVVGWALHFLHTLIGHALLDVGVTRHLAGMTELPVPWEQLREQLVLHVVGGISAQAAGSRA
ncbi:TetR/AcrR family transcriptional regulator [Ideonella sp. B508-1]|uniref:TetR/AcrR family transcriptional regulator n=1 Tax=Ideonella sp. B508-1 TaxID=137716 RepID=UPI000A0245DE|nr:TetR/AcrR family transcriptional regulator [Ideonella sp. B508-1]